MRKLVTGLFSAMLILVAGSAAAIELRSAPEVSPELLQLEQTNGTEQYAGRRMYVIQLAGKPGLTYEGGIDGYAATAPAEGQRYNANASHVQQYTGYLVSKHDEKVASVGASGFKTYSYAHAMNGFAAMLTAEEVDQLRGDKAVLNVWEDFSFEIDTNNSPEFLGLLDRKEGLRKKLKLKGEDVIVGILDTGAVQEHPSFSDMACKDDDDDSDSDSDSDSDACKPKRVYGPPPVHWNGICQEGEAWAADDCNNKLIGARYYVDGFLAGRGSLVEGEFMSPRDSSGHGSHTASTAAGNEVVASLNGTPLAEISGMAPRARVAVYKVCWLSPGATNFSCFFSDSMMATDAAVADGVDVLNFSVGTAAAFTDPQDLAFLRAASDGVFVARSAGNSGPGPATTNAGEPWVTTVAASTQSGTAFALAAVVNSPASVAGSYAALEGAITQPLLDSGPITDDLVAAEPIDACVPLSNSIDNKIALIARGSCTFVAKIENAVNAGARAVLMYTDGRPKTVMGGTATDLTTSIPGVMIDNAPGLAILAELDAGNPVNATLSAASFTTEPLEGNIMAGFSSRGPYTVESDWVKPDITAPGVRILAAYAPDQADGSAGDFFAYLQGTSMSSPHIAGLGALVIEAHPDWSPAQVKSALMTTARQDLVKEDGATPADAFDFGAGHVDPNKAVDPGLTYDAGLLDYLIASCGTVSPLVSPADCEFIEAIGISTSPADLNLPSIGIGELPGTQTVTRTVTAVKGYKSSNRRDHDDDSDSDSDKKRAHVYNVSVEPPPGFDVSVSPSQLRLRPGESASYSVTITNETAPPNQWTFGSLTWSDKKGRDVRSPIAVNAKAIIAPPVVAGTGTDGTENFDVTFGYTGDYSALEHGLANPALGLVTVEDDPFNSFEFFGPGTAIAYFAEVPEGTALARWSTFNEYTSGNDDVDLYLYYCPLQPSGNFSCSQVASSGNVDSNEQIDVLFPNNDPTNLDPYLVFMHGYDTDGGLPADVILFDWTFGVDDKRGNLTVDAPTSATIGETATLTIDWTGLFSGAGAKQLGAISHSNEDGIQELTVIEITNDEGKTICDFGLCP